MLLALKRKTIEDILLDSIIIIACVFVVFITIYPFYYCLIVSFNKGVYAAKGNYYFFPPAFTLDNYAQIAKDNKWLNALFISLSRTLIGTTCGVLFTGLFAFGLSFNELLFRKVYFRILIFSMYFSGGLIPYFVLLRSVGLIDNFLVYVVPLLLDSFMTLVMIAFFREIPRSIIDSAKIDGANELRIFFNIIIFASLPAIATAALFMSVYQWNTWFDATFFIQKKGLKTLSFLMMELINKSHLTTMGDSGQGASAEAILAASQQRTYTPRSLQMATMIVSITPILLAYPFAQKYFIKGIMLGSIKE
jgi:putative aldouronate transport system permease protein